MGRISIRFLTGITLRNFNGLLSFLKCPYEWLCEGLWDRAFGIRRQRGMLILACTLQKGSNSFLY